MTYFIMINKLYLLFTDVSKSQNGMGIITVIKQYNDKCIQNLKSLFNVYKFPKNRWYKTY